MGSSDLLRIFVLCTLVLLGVHCDDPKISGQRYNDKIVETDHWGVELTSGSNALEIAERHGHELVGKIQALPGVFIFKQRDSTIHGVTHPHHNESSEILWSEKQFARELATRQVLSDPLYSSQWHLHDTPSVSNVNINILRAWGQGLHGEGIRIAIVDDGLEYTHPDLSANYAADSSYDFNFNDNDPFPDDEDSAHGTCSAGAAAAGDNAACGVGSAYKAQVAGLRILAAGTTDYQEAAAMSHEWDKNHIFSNSWGPVDDGRRLEGPGRLASAALELGTRVGRNGSGSIYVWAGGNGRSNGDNCNYDGWANSRFTISIAAVDSNGKQAYYSECCSMILASAPSSGAAYGITTTDLAGERGRSSGDCTRTFGGTSAAAPIASGVVALILQKNPNLGWRDVQGVLIGSAKMIQVSDSDWQMNGGGFNVNHKFGFGLIDAAAAVDLAGEWTNLPAQINASSASEDARPIPDAHPIPDSLPIHDGYGKYQSTVNITESFTIEHVTLYLNAAHARRGDLAIKLISPSGTVAKLAEEHCDSGSNYDWTFGSIFSWGEDSSGLWTLEIFDTTPDNIGFVNRWVVTAYGH